MKLKVLDLFSGIGGFSLGLERTGGFETVAFCEIDPFCRRVLAKHWPDVRQYEDVRELTAERLRADGIVPDVICGGFPCQDASVANIGGMGASGDRTGLFAEAVRLAGETRSIVLMENVTGLFSRGFGDVLRALACIGFDAEWECFRARDVGADHERNRLFILAYPRSTRRQGFEQIVGVLGRAKASLAQYGDSTLWRVAFLGFGSARTTRRPWAFRCYGASASTRTRQCRRPANPGTHRQRHPGLHSGEGRSMTRTPMKLDAQALEPCPFCGGNNVAQGASADRISVWCFCGARGPDVAFPEHCDPGPPIDECRSAWNRRAPLSRVPAPEPVAKAPPREPHDGMIEAGEETLRAGEEWGRTKCAAEVWTAMYDEWSKQFGDDDSAPVELDSLKRELETVKRERDELDALYHEGGTWEQQLAAAEAELSATKAKLDEAVRLVERSGPALSAARTLPNCDCAGDEWSDEDAQNTTTVAEFFRDRRAFLALNQEQADGQ